MEELKAERNELYKAAVACEMDIEDAFDDVADSIDVATKVTSSISPKDLGNSIAGYWSTFLPTYSSKCIKRWSKRCGKSKDYKAMEKLWITSFEPVWMAGCNLAKADQLHRMSGIYDSVVSRFPDKLSKNEEESLERWAEDLLTQLTESIPGIITEFKERFRKTMPRTLEELKEYDSASFLGKLKRWESSRYQ